MITPQYNMRQDDEPLTPMKLRERSGVTQRQVAASLDVTIGTVSSWERGNKVANLTLSEVQQLTELYQCTVKEFHEAFGLVQVKITLGELDAILQLCGVSLDELSRRI